MTRPHTDCSFDGALCRGGRPEYVDFFDTLLSQSVAEEGKSERRIQRQRLLATMNDDDGDALTLETELQQEDQHHNAGRRRFCTCGLKRSILYHGTAMIPFLHFLVYLERSALV